MLLGYCMCQFFGSPCSRAGNVIFMLLSGVIPIAHNSGGPREDIVIIEEGSDGPQSTGYLAENVQEYCEAITKVRQLSLLG